MKEKLKQWYHKWILGQEKCPTCGEWMNNSGINMSAPWEDEYYCPVCDKYIYM